MLGRALLLLALATCAATGRPRVQPPAAVLIPHAPPRVTRLVDVTLHGDVRFGREERWIIIAAAHAWRQWTHGRMQLAIVWDWDERSYLQLADRPHIVRAPEWLPKVAALDAREQARVLGYVAGPEIGIVADRCHELYPVVLHELGHFGGLDHVDDEAAIMSPTSHGITPTRADLDECRRVGLCESAGGAP